MQDFGRAELFSRELDVGVRCICAHYLRNWVAAVTDDRVLYVWDFGGSMVQEGESASSRGSLLRKLDIGAHGSHAKGNHGSGEVEEQRKAGFPVSVFFWNPSLRDPTHSRESQRRRSKRGISEKKIEESRECLILVLSNEICIVGSRGASRIERFGLKHFQLKQITCCAPLAGKGLAVGSLEGRVSIWTDIDKKEESVTFYDAQGQRTPIIGLCTMNVDVDGETTQGLAICAESGQIDLVTIRPSGGEDSGKVVVKRLYQIKLALEDKAVSATLCKRTGRLYIATAGRMVHEVKSFVEHKTLQVPKLPSVRVEFKAPNGVKVKVLDKKRKVAKITSSASSPFILIHTETTSLLSLDMEKEHLKEVVDISTLEASHAKKTKIVDVDIHERLPHVVALATTTGLSVLEILPLQEPIHSLPPPELANQIACFTIPLHGETASGQEHGVWRVPRKMEGVEELPKLVLELDDSSLFFQSENMMESSHTRRYLCIHNSALQTYSIRHMRKDGTIASESVGSGPCVDFSWCLVNVADILTSPTSPTATAIEVFAIIVPDMLKTYIRVNAVEEDGDQVRFVEVGSLFKSKADKLLGVGLQKTPKRLFGGPLLGIGFTDGTLTFHSWQSLTAKESSRDSDPEEESAIASLPLPLNVSWSADNKFCALCYPSEVVVLEAATAGAGGGKRRLEVCYRAGLSGVTTMLWFENLLFTCSPDDVCLVVHRARMWIRVADSGIYRDIDVQKRPIGVLGILTVSQKDRSLICLNERAEINKIPLTRPHIMCAMSLAHWEYVTEFPLSYASKWADLSSHPQECVCWMNEMGAQEAILGMENAALQEKIAALSKIGRREDTINMLERLQGESRSSITDKGVFVDLASFSEESDLKLKALELSGSVLSSSLEYLAQGKRDEFLGYIRSLIDGVEVLSETTDVATAIALFSLIDKIEATKLLQEIGRLPESLLISMESKELTQVHIAVEWNQHLRTKNDIVLQRKKC